MSQSYTYDNLHPTATQLLYLLNNTTYRGRIIKATRNTPLVDHLLGDYQFVQRQYQHFDSLMTAANLQLNRLAVDIAASGFMIPGQLTVPIICAPEIFPPHPFSQSDYAATCRGETSPTGGLEYPPRSPTEALEDYELVESSQATSAPPITIYRFNSDGFDRPEPSPSPKPRPSPIPPTTTRTLAPPEPVPQSIQLRVQFSPEVDEIPITRADLDRTPTPPPWIGMPQQTLGTPPLGPSDPSPPNSLPLPENNDDATTTEPESRTSSSAPSPISIPEFLNAINVIGGVTIHRTVETTSVQSVTHTNLIISLNIAHDYDEVNKFLSHGLLRVIQLLMALRRTTLIRPPSPISPMSPTSIEEEEEAPPVFTIVRITDNREPITLTTNNGEERMFVPVRYVNGATVFEAGTSNQNRG
ncbi:hypothetical protein Moror_15347 [Moniliophthora roreri MCA 2997]|uniref:Uncharacterized protein n=1 Tax=Moniliophthora roreri (strain MCA 2997) TaxID=1381753 RepID=V2X4U6_MONRO|nr:hypothetical protein Moror_15347 [Moniliophthora roreri MCA 2997]